MNCYASLAVINSRLNVSSYDTMLLALLNAASRFVDKLTGRFFYVDEATRYFDGAGSVLFFDDVLSITALKLDEDGDATYEATMDATDYILYPLNSYPKSYTKVSNNGNYGGFASGVKKGVEITGVFGYGNGLSATPYSDSGITVVADDATETELDVSAEGTIAAGHTIRVESEQMYVSAATSDDTKKITVVRAVNGTTGAAHATKAAYIYEYPDLVVEATLIQAMRWFKRKDSAFSTVVGSPDLGQMEIYKGLDADVKMMLAPLTRKRVIAV